MLRVLTGNIYKVKSKKKQSRVDISKKNNFGVISKAMTDERIGNK